MPESMHDIQGAESPSVRTGWQCLCAAARISSGQRRRLLPFMRPLPPSPRYADGGYIPDIGERASLHDWSELGLYSSISSISSSADLEDLSESFSIATRAFSLQVSARHARPE
jgi:hypothetical protein